MAGNDFIIAGVIGVIYPTNGATGEISGIVVKIQST